MPIPVCGGKGDVTPLSELHGIGQEIVDYLPQPLGIADIRIRQLRRQPAMQRQTLVRRQRPEAGADFLQQTSRMEGDTVYLDLVEIQTMEIQQVGDQPQQVLRRLLHIVQVELLTAIHSEAGQQVGIAHDGAKRRLEIMRDGQHQLLAHGQQVFGLAAGFLQLAPVAVVAGDVAPYQ